MLIKNPRSALGTLTSKTQGSPLVHTPTKPKVPLWYAHMQQLWRPLTRVQVQPSELPPHHWARPFIRLKPILIPHNHQRSTFACQIKPVFQRLLFLSSQTNIRVHFGIRENHLLRSPSRYTFFFQKPFVFWPVNFPKKTGDHLFFQKHVGFYFFS